MKLLPDATIKMAYRVTKSQLTRRLNRGEDGPTVDELAARKEFLERLYSFSG